VGDGLGWLHPHDAHPGLLGGEQVLVLGFAVPVRPDLLPIELVEEVDRMRGRGDERNDTLRVDQLDDDACLAVPARKRPSQMDAGRPRGHAIFDGWQVELVADLHRGKRGSFLGRQPAIESDRPFRVQQHHARQCRTVLLELVDALLAAVPDLHGLDRLEDLLLAELREQGGDVVVKGLPRFDLRLHLLEVFLGRPKHQTSLLDAADLVGLRDLHGFSPNLQHRCQFAESWPSMVGLLA
jgi:hypothetical protein